jgi:hypothetical protein
VTSTSGTTATATTVDWDVAVDDFVVLSVVPVDRMTVVPAEPVVAVAVAPAVLVTVD